jgi:DNA-binding transcriptional regulator YhcF (GntR family)
LASYLSVRPETLSRVFNKLSNEGLLEIHKNQITILKPQALKKIIGY